MADNDGGATLCREFPAAQRACTLRITRDLSLADSAGIVRLRQDNFYSDPCDPRYALGGVHLCPDAERVVQIHIADPTARLVLVHDRADARHLVACARFVLVDPGEAAYDRRIQAKLPGAPPERILFNTLIIVDKDWRRQKVVVEGVERKICDAIFEARVAFARARGCMAAMCDVAIAPVANNVSLRFIARHGMVEIGDVAPVIRDGQRIGFKRYAMRLDR